MKVYIKNKFMSLGGNSSVVNENKEMVFKVKGKWLSPTKKKRICDRDGKVLYTVRNKFWKLWYNSALVYEGKRVKIAKIRDKRFTLNNEYYVTGYKDEIKVQGRLFSLECQIIRNGEVVGYIRRNPDLWVDSFELEADEADIPFFTAIVIALDNISDKKRNQRN